MRKYPFASDTPDGIRRWWLPADLAAIDPRELTGVLDELVAEGLMRRVQLPDGGVLYASALPSGTGQG
jgi:hypothetical protein